MPGRSKIVVVAPPQGDATVNIYRSDGTTAVTAYTTATGASTVSQPATVSASASTTFWVPNDEVAVVSATIGGVESAGGSRSRWTGTVSNDGVLLELVYPVGASSLSTETVLDTVGTALTAGTGVTITPNDGADTITIATSPVWTIIDERVLGTAAASISFTSIPATYAHLVAIGQLRGSDAATSVVLNARINNDSAANYDSQNVYGNNTTAAAGATAAGTAAVLGTIVANNATAGYASSIMVELPCYRATTFYKSGLFRLTRDQNGAAVNTVQYNGQFSWRATTAINRFDLYPLVGNFMAGSQVTLYGIAGVS